MFSFFTLLDTFYFLLPAIFSFVAIVCLSNKLTRQENLMKIYDLFSYFRSLLFIRAKIMPKERIWNCFSYNLEYKERK